MKKILTLLAVFLFWLNGPQANAQDVVGTFGITVNLEPYVVASWGSSAIQINPFNQSIFGTSNCNTQTLNIGGKNSTIKSVSQKAGANNRNKLVAVYQAYGQYFVDVISIGSVCPLQSHVDTTYSFGLTIPSGSSLTKIIGDDLYCIYGGMLGVLRTSTGAQLWAWDTAGFNTGGYVNDICLDTAQNVYAVTYSGLFFQASNGNTWSKVTAYPGGSGSNVFVDKQNRLYVSSGSNVYIGTNNGANWTSGTLPSSAGTISNDAFGNLYSTSGNRAYRSVNNGVTWTRIDQGITGLALDTSLSQIINNISGDTFIYAATIWGLFMSNDQGTTWTIASQGIQSDPNGFWLFNNGRQVANTDLGTFIKNAPDTAWTQTYPTSGKYLKMGIIQGDTLGNIYTVMNWNGLTLPFISTDQGATWQLDTAGLTAVPHASLSTYYVDEYGSSHISGYDSTGFNTGVYLLYSKSSTGSYSIDTAGFGAQMPNFANILTYCSDHSGYLYMSGHNNTGVSVWRRPVTGGTWLPDTAGIGRGYITLSAYDHHGGVIGLNWVSNALYHRNATSWKSMSYPTSVYSFSTPAGITGNPGGGLISSFQLYSYTNNTYDYYGIYCTHDEGATWSYVPGLDSTGVNSAGTFGDTTYLLTTIGLYKMTCNGVVVDTVPSGPNGISALNADGVKLFPNPTNGDCHISLNSSITDGTLIIQDLMGRAVKIVTLSMGETTFHTRDMNAGLYICTISSGGKVISTRKLVVN